MFLNRFLMKNKKMTFEQKKNFLSKFLVIQRGSMAPQNPHFGVVFDECHNFGAVYSLLDLFSDIVVTLIVSFDVKLPQKYLGLT